ncbi:MULTISPECIES: RES family NAD+ phosphorylase [Pseudomonas]|uniref:RES family NAD+ phosphorylase n=1 Tax=Pseudomonas TaxID=286 RepID=UPI0014645F0B|nr:MULTISPECIES: RES family NAD+ phosphorylase [Pseudomonas]NMY98526.1 RES family NAD+ phosphorylase [Pseudomonas proteolytica]NMZ22693.1 RES family NAD+ phosphorylase [Pseudomonas proteolytica]QJI19796.1 RES family NAD+ phosphorylase [Pseudomonas sp. ADAK21]QJI25047.1 RES family NAD+ phosphorylase [Pseudomonas sp. ADAK20]
MVRASQLGDLPGGQLQAYRLVNSKFPPIALFDDVADAEEFEALYQIQALTNPRLGNEVGRIELIARREIPFGIVGCSYAIAPFTHVNPAGSRFSAGDFGVLYLAATIETALAEVRHHQNQYWSGVRGLNYERFVFRALACSFAGDSMKDATSVPMNDPIYDPDDYSHAQRLGGELKKAGCPGLRYLSVRAEGDHCWALLTPRPVSSIVQASHYEMVWNGQITSVSQIREA